MNGNLDLAERLDSSFGDGPPLPPADVHLRAGRRAPARRRLAPAAGGVAAVVAFVGLAVAVTGGDDPRETRTDVATPPTTSQGPGRTDGATTAPVPAGDSDVELTEDGTLLTAPGVDVLRRIRNPLDLAPPGHSLAVAYTRDGAETWALLTYERQDDGSASASVSSDPARKSFATLGQWVADQVALAQGDPALQLVEFGPGETLQPLDGVEVVAQTGDVDLPSSFAGPGDRTAVAQVTYEGRRWFVLARQLGRSDPEYFPTAGSVGGASIADFLAYAEGQYEGGEGLR